MKPSQTSINNFNLCWNHYGVEDEEVRYEKKRIMANFDEADRCYSVIAAWIRNENSINKAN